MKLPSWIIPVGIVGAMILFGFMVYLSVSNQEIRLRNKIAANQTALKNTYDAVWKIISGRAGVANEYAEKFRENYVAIMEGRYGGDGADSLLLFITESNPEFSDDLYKDVSAAIEAQRTIFRDAQNQLVDLKREHDNLLATAPSAWFLSGRKPIEIQLVTSSKTEEAFATGREDEDPNPFAGS